MSRKCRHCRLFLSSNGSKCAASAGSSSDTCSDFSEGRPFVPTFHGRPVQDVKFDPEKPAAWSFWISDRQVLMVAWEVDHNQYGHFRCFLMRLGANGVETKPFAPRASAPAFAGEVVVKGPKENDLWRSFGYEDEDEFDVEQNLINKPREIKLFPSRED